MKIELDDEVTDAIVVATLREHLKYAKKNIKDLRKMKKLETYQAEDLGNNVKLVDSIEDVLHYFGA